MASNGLRWKKSTHWRRDIDKKDTENFQRECKRHAQQQQQRHTRKRIEWWHFKRVRRITNRLASKTITNCEFNFRSVIIETKNPLNANNSSHLNINKQNTKYRIPNESYSKQWKCFNCLLRWGCHFFRSYCSQQVLLFICFFSFEFEFKTILLENDFSKQPTSMQISRNEERMRIKTWNRRNNTISNWNS